MLWQTTRFDIDLSRARVMGIVNVTPDSFSDGGVHDRTAAAIAHCERLLDEGAELLDIGGESTRPGAAPVAVDIERQRVMPVMRAALTLGVPVSVDTSSPELMREALDLGADIVNDVRALRRPGALQAVASHARAGVCLMHMKGEPDRMAAEALYGDVVAEVRLFLTQRLAELESAGVARQRIVLDPGIGFAKDAGHNLQLLARQRELLEAGRPLLVGWSRKGTLGRITGRPVGDRLVASVAVALAAVQRGASIVRVHDVKDTVDALRIWRAAERGALEGE